MTTDPFDSLREPNVPLAPRPGFAAELRRRVSVALGATREETPMPEIREYTPAPALDHAVPRDPRPGRRDRVVHGGVRRAAARRPDRDGRRPNRPRRAPHRRLGDHAGRRVSARGPPQPAGTRRQHGRSPGARARLRRDVRARGRTRRDAVASGRGELRRSRRRDPRPVRPPLVRRDAPARRRRARGGRARPAVRRSRLPRAGGARRRARRTRSTARCSAGPCTRPVRASTSSRSHHREASRAVTTTPTR